MDGRRDAATSIRPTVFFFPFSFVFQFLLSPKSFSRNTMGSKADDVSHGGATAAVLLDDPATEMKRDGPCVVNESKDKAARSAEAADGLQAQDQPDKANIPIKSTMENSKSSGEEDAAAEAEEKQALTTETNQSEQAKEENEENIVQEEEEEEVSIANSKDSSATANDGHVNLLLPPADPLSVPHVTLPPKEVEEELEKGDDATQRTQQHSSAKKHVQSETTTAMIAVQPTIGVKGAIAKCTTPVEFWATSQSNGDYNDGEEKKMDDEDLAIAQPRSPPTTSGTNTSGILTTAKVVPSPLGVSSMSTPQSDTTKAKSMPTPSSTACNSGGIDGRSLEELMTTDDMANATMEQKVDGLKLLLSIIKNLSDPELSTDPSHHTIPWDCQGDSVSGILRSCPFVQEYLTVRIGFAPLTKSGETFLCLFDTDDEGSYAGIDESILQRALLEVNYVLARLNRPGQEEKTMPEKNKENKLSDQNEPRPSVDVSANQEVANTCTTLTLASGSNAIIGDINNGNVANKLVRVEGSDHNVSKDDVAKTAGVPDPTVTDNSSPPVSMHEAKAKLCASPAGSTDVETETEDVPETAMMVEDGNDGKLPFFHHTATNVDVFVQNLIKPGARKKRAHCAHFDTVSIDRHTTLGAWVLVNGAQFIVPDGTANGFGSVGIPHKDINIQAFRNDNAHFVEGGVEPKADTDCFELDIRIELTDGRAIHCAFDGCDPDRIVNEDGRTARQTLCQFAQSFVRIHECWLKKNPEKVEEVSSQKQNASSTEAERPSSPNAKGQRSCAIDLASYRANSKREQMLNDFVSYVSEEAPALVPMALAWAEGNCSTDDMICNVAGLLRSQKDIDRFNELLLEEANGYSVESRCGAAAWNGDPFLFYRCPDGIQTTDRKTRQLLILFNEAQSRDEQCIFLDDYLRPLPGDYHEMKESNLVSLVLGVSECKEFALAIRLLEGAEAVYAEQDAPPEDVFALMYNLRGQVFLKQAKEMIAETQANAGSCIGYLFEDNDISGDSYQIHQVLSDASEWLTTAKTTMEGMMTDPIPEFGAQDECELALLQDLCTLTMRIGKSYELQGDTPNAIETYEEALSLLYTVRPASSSRIATAHLDLGDLCAKTLIPDSSGTWTGDNDNMVRAVGHYLSGARSVAAFVATESRKVDSDFFIGPGANTLSQVREVLHEHEYRGEQINIGIWACREISDMVEVLRNSDAMHFGQPWFYPVNQAVDLVRNRLREMARHPMHRDGRLGRVKVKQERKEALVGPLPFTINEGDAHNENSLPPLELENHYCNTRASKISKMEKYGDVTWARECNNAQEEEVGASFYDDDYTNHCAGV